VGSESGGHDRGSLGAQDAFLALLQAKGLAHERAYLEVLRSQEREMVDLAAAGSGGYRFGRTREVMRVE
jgi:uncharacterized protein